MIIAYKYILKNNLVICYIFLILFFIIGNGSNTNDAVCCIIKNIVRDIKMFTMTYQNTKSMVL